ncbi:hypothetical protein MPC1_10360002 [Methylocella tundrae]|nr:hypothetical protein MPC1_10360002 [Methylocella tundrae]
MMWRGAGESNVDRAEGLMLNTLLSIAFDEGDRIIAPLERRG